MPNLSATELRQRIESAFETVFPDYAEHTDGVIVQLNDDETIDVQLEGITTFRAEIHSDDDGYLYFGPYDPDYEAEYPNEPRTDPVCIRVRVLSETTDD
jgi:hypothetical protein